ncbi:N-6 DNA methylase [Candidatus Parabeggiatoa sp. HSG14]|uniref:N-6 DNA methylase n=1 Tax=Candidatus Parabeggiatoa sp. HSG14 TaxID=3055593 RepID=UPI0025A7CEEA|nr:N-6 DNA methylase [Thiotrichales bacterium HSG14]
MIIKDNFKALLRHLQFIEEGNIFTKNFNNDIFLLVDFKNEQLEYPEVAGLKINERQTCNFSQAENAVVFECVHKLLAKGYQPKHIELEPKWKVGHGASGGRADILVKNQRDKPLLIIECKTYGKEFDKAWKETLDDGGQLFSYAQQIAETEFLCLYASEFDVKNDILLINQRVIAHRDNKKILEQGNKLLSFKDASNVKKRYEVWKETYQLEYTQTGIFEENIQAYQIGKNKYALDVDTRLITDKDKEGKYHQFRTILRQHNIARRETAFEVLVNLFLSKIVDEEENKNDLKFYWKGVVYDNYYDFVDRLQNLYQIGMRKFLNDEIMYISNDEIDNAFWAAKNRRNATKKTIKEYFRKLKFFSNNAFSFINVHNERLFNKNAKVLVEIVQMWQNLRLKTKEQNQFLGDMFEFFLDNSIKQSEGQFFTPIPITKFIVMSLPLADKIQHASEPLRVIDYACGAGHFLTEYAHQIKPLVEQYKGTELAEYYSNIVGIEKEDRLAKVAKVSAYMYGQEQIKILEEDALSDIAGVKLANFNVLVANPPFAVEGFLANLTEKQKEQYELIKTTGINSNTNNVQCFFIERAKQLMAPGGMVGIIVPSSVLSNSDATHVGTREILLKYFDIVAIVELGSGTFGKTGTNTVVLFLRRKVQKPEPAEHYQNRVDDYFDGLPENTKEQVIYQDWYLIEKYCEYTELPVVEYKKLFGATVDNIDDLDELFNTDIFKDYLDDFNGSTEIKNLKRKPIFKNKSKVEQDKELNQRLIGYLFAIEKEKLLYFMLAYESEQQVLIVKSPSGNKEQKQFLGYEWSGAKGNEGIKYSGGSTVNDIVTPLFDPNDVCNIEKINYLIQQNFLGIKPTSKQVDHVTYANVSDILDFSRKDFNKAFSLTPKKSVSINTKWELVKLENVMTIVRGASPRPINNFITSDVSGVNWIKIGDVKEDSKYIIQTEEKITQEGALKSRPVKVGDFILSNSMSFGRPYILRIDGCIHDGWLLMTDFVKELDKDYLYEILSYKTTQQQFIENAGGGVVQNLNTERVKSVKIPLPPKKVQQQIVSECEVIDKNVEQANAAIDKAKMEIEEKANDLYSKFKLIKLKSLSQPPQYGANESAILGNPANDYRYIRITDIHEDGSLNNDFQTANKIEGKYILEEGDFLFARSGNTVGKTFLYENKYGKAIYAGYLIRFKIDKNRLLPTFLKLITKSNVYKKWIIDTQTGSSQPNINGQMYSNLEIPVPPLSKQKQLVSAIEKLETKINEAKQIVENANDQKQAIMEKYL